MASKLFRDRIIFALELYTILLFPFFWVAFEPEHKIALNTSRTHFFRPFLSSSEVQNLQRVQTSVQAFTWLLGVLKIWSQSLFFKWSSLFLGTAKWPSKGIKPKGHVHFYLFFLHNFSLILYSATTWRSLNHEQPKEILPTMEILWKIQTLINRTCPIFRRIWMKWCSTKNMPVRQCRWLAQWQMNLWSSKYPL